MFTYFLLILGCQFNYYDAEKLARALDDLGGSETIDVKDADLGIVFACSVRQKAADRILGHIRNWKKSNIKIKTVITACVLPADKKRFAGKVDLIANDKSLINNPAKLIQKFNLLNITQESSLRHSHFLKKVRMSTLGKNNFKTIDRCNDYQLFNKHTAYVTITAGCNNYCTYCAVPYTRGREISRPELIILAEIRDLFTRQGIDHIILLGQNVNSYGLSDYAPRDMRKNKSPSGNLWTPKKPSPFVRLLRQIDAVKGIKKISFLSPNPQDISLDLIDWISKTPKFSRELHLPLQSGSDRILRAMNRRYTAADYLALVRNIKRAASDIKLSTDIIVGFPGETNKDFQDTVNLVKKCQFKKAFISIFSPRPGTAAARLKDNVSYKTKKSRWLLLNNMINS